MERRGRRQEWAVVAEKISEFQSFVARLDSGQRRVDVVEFPELAEVLGFDASSVINDLRNEK